MRVELEPAACYVGRDGRDFERVQDDWVVEGFPAPDVVTIRNVATSQVAKLGKDHIYDFRSNPNRSTEGLRCGFLVLKVQIFVEGDSIRFRPNRAPGESVAAVDRIEQLEREAAQLRAAGIVPLQQRSATAEQLEVLRATVEGVKPEELLVLTFDSRESQRYARQFERVLESMGWKMKNLLLGPGDPGGEFRLGWNERVGRTAGYEALAAGLKAAGIEVREGAFKSDADCAVSLDVGVLKMTPYQRAVDRVQ